jgi:hypothetical protein
MNVSRQDVVDTAMMRGEAEHMIVTCPVRAAGGIPSCQIIASHGECIRPIPLPRFHLTMIRLRIIA